MSKKVLQTPIIKQESVSGLVKKISVYAPEIAKLAKPGQFVHIKLSDRLDPLLRRPFSISDVDRERGTISFIYRIVGRGTAYLAELKEDSVVDCLGPLGNGFDLSAGSRSLLVGGGMGLAPLIYLAKMLCPQPVELLMGGRTKEELFWQDMFSGICENLHITTDDGSYGVHGNVADMLPELLAKNPYDIIYACGPHGMLARVEEIALKAKIPCQVSLEKYMACGVGACLSCTCAAKDGKRRKVCTDGPVFWAGEVEL